MRRSLWTLAVTVTVALCGCALAFPSVSPAEQRNTFHVSVGPAGGNTDHVPPGLFAVSDDGDVFFSTDEVLTSDDAGFGYDLFKWSNGTLSRLTTGPASNAFKAMCGLSSDGEQVLISTTASLVPADTDTLEDVYQYLGGTWTLISTGPTDPDSRVSSCGGIRPSPDGSRVYFVSDDPMTSDDADTTTDLFVRSGATTTLLSRGPGEDGPAADAVYGLHATDDGSRVIFYSYERLVGEDTDDTQDIYEVTGGTTTLLSTSANEPAIRISPPFCCNYPHFFWAASADGSRVVWATKEPLVRWDRDIAQDLYTRSAGLPKLLSTSPTDTDVGVTDSGLDTTFCGASPDASRVYFQTWEPLVGADTDKATDVYERNAAGVTLASVSSTGANGPGPATCGPVSRDGSHVVFRTLDVMTADDTNGFKDCFDRSAGTTTLLTTGPTGSGGRNAYPLCNALSADGTRAYFTTELRLVAQDTDGDGDVYERFNGVTTLISTGPTDPGGHGSSSVFLSTTPSGSHVLFLSPDHLTSSDTDIRQDLFVSVLVPGGPSAQSFEAQDPLGPLFPQSAGGASQ